MNLEQVYFITQILASFAVVASLLYLARQVHQNTRIMQINAAAERVQRDHEIVDPIIRSREIAELHHKGNQDFAGMDAVDQTRSMLFDHRAQLHWQNMFEMYQEGLLKEENWREVEWVIRYVMRRQSSRHTWQMFRPSFDPAFCTFMDEVIAGIDRQSA